MAERIMRILENYQSYEEAYEAMVRILKASHKYCEKYMQGCMCRKCLMRDRIETELIYHFYGRLLEYLRQ